MGTWLAGGWSSHFEFFDEKGRRVRCDFFSRPPRVSPAAIDRLFESASDPMLVVDLESLIRMKQTQRAKDYAVIGELSARLPPAQEILLTTDPDRILELATDAGADPSGRARRGAWRPRRRGGGTRTGAGRTPARGCRAHEGLRAGCRTISRGVRAPRSAERRLPQAHPRVMSLADRHLPETIDIPGGGHADAE